MTPESTDEAPSVHERRETGSAWRVEAGPHLVYASDGAEFHIDHPISVGQADLLQRVLVESNLNPDDVFAIELNECGAFAELVDREGHSIDEPEPEPKRVALSPQRPRCAYVHSSRRRCSNTARANGYCDTHQPEEEA